MRPPVWVIGVHAAILAMAAGLLVLDRLAPPDMGRGTEMSVVVTDSGGRALRVFPVEDGRWRLAADIDRIDPAFIAALIEVEDQRFYDHAGVDPLAVIRAGFTSARAGRIVSGASTLTMQTARLLEPRPRNLGSKIVESWRALQLERRLTKDEILELYLSLTPYGGNLEGIRAASWAYFGREPERLTAEQIALLIALPQSPEVRRPDLRPEHARTSRAAILTRLAEAGLLTGARAEEAAGEPLPSRADFPAGAWHAAEEARRRAPGVTEIRTSIDGGLQAELEALARAEAEEAGTDVQIAILVVETESRAVRAAVGSASRGRQGGWIDLTDRARSPGSTLKPFIYALAFDDGFAAAGTRMADVPRAFSAYQPENFDRTFRGDVTVAEALQHSLNVPAVLALDAVGARRFAASLDFAGAHGRIADSGEDEAGLAIALGGVGLTVREVATLYAALGDGGSARPLSWLEDRSDIDADAPAQALMTPETADEIVSILRRAPHPGGRMPAELSRGAPRIAFKTGTSWGFRDAWAAGTGDGFTVVVWVGRPDGTPRPGVTGREGALPILFDVFDRARRYAPETDTGWGRAETPDDHAPPAPLRRFGDTLPPEIVFPPDGSEVWANEEGRPLVLAGRGTGRLNWFVDGAPAALNGAGDPVWLPPQRGFYTIAAVDDQGRTATARVRIRTSADGPAR